MLSQSDRIVFSLQIVTSTSKIAGIQQAQSMIATQITSAQALDTANDNLFIPANNFATAYQAELSDLDGNGRTTITEQTITSAANKTFQNAFFPNDSNTTVPDLSATHNIWTQTTPFALGYGLGKNYSEAYTPVTSEPSLINAILSLITSTTTPIAYTDYELTTGTYPPPTYPSDPTIEGIQSNMMTAVNTLITFLNAEVAIIVTNDTTAPNQANNTAAINNINNVILPALNLWLTYPAFDPSGIGPSQLHSTQLNALSTALNNRLIFITTRISQLNTVLGTIVQNVTTGLITSSSGLYGQRFSCLNLRLNNLGGSLIQLVNLQAASSAQSTLITNIQQSVNIYSMEVSASLLQSPGNNTNIISAVNASLFNQGDTIYIYAEGQTELQRAISSINGNSITLNDIVPLKYNPAQNARIYKDIS